MPINYQQIQSQIKSLGQQAREQEKRIQTRREKALQLLRQYAERLEDLKALLARAERENPNLRCALPLDEPLTAALPTPPLSEALVILAADGSQIDPDRHAAVEFSVINAGAFRVQPNHPIPPAEIIKTRLLFGEDLRPEGVHISEEIVALLRDLAERELLAELAAGESLPVVTLTDGPLELFREKETRAAKIYQLNFTRYLAALEMLESMSAVTAGYVDRPRANLVVNLLELTQIAEPEFARKAGKEHELEGVYDADLYVTLLQPGERSPIYAIKSPSARDFTHGLALHFFYINVGREGQPSIARVEVPAWVVQHPILLNRLHATLVSQCQVIGSRPFPYALHRAHEVAVVSHFEKEQLENLIVKTLIEQGFLPPHVSNKQFLKNSFGKRTRYTP